MSFLPSHGFRHAATLLLTSRARAIPPNASSDEVANATAQLARDLVALADDTRAPAETPAWLIDEFHRTVDRLPYVFDRARAKQTGAAILGDIGRRARHHGQSRDLFLIYVPEDRLPIAGPLAVELTKRHVSVAFAEYAVASKAELSAAIGRGLADHRGGVILWTPVFERTTGAHPPHATTRLRVLRPPTLAPAVGELMAWVVTLRVSKP